MKCVNCKNSNQISFKDKYLFEIEEDKKYFGDIKIYYCGNCSISFVYPIPEDKNLSYFYKKIYRAPGRPPFFFNGDYEELKLQCLDHKNLNYLLYLTTLIEINNIKKIYDFGAGNGDLGYLLKKKFPHLELYCTESDQHCKKILKERGYTNFEDLNLINEKFDLIITLHSLEHLTDTSIFTKFLEILNKNGKIFFEVPNCTEEYFRLRIYDSPHLIFWNKKAFQKVAEKNNLKFINFSYASYPFEYDQKFSLESKNIYLKNFKTKFPIFKIKKYLKKIIPKYLISLIRDLKKNKKESEDIINWFSNNTGNNCYIRGILERSK